MIEYPFPIPGDAFPVSASILERADTVQGTNDLGVTGCARKDEKCAITRLTLEASGKRSTSFGEASDPGLPTTKEERFHFAPDEDNVTVAWELERQDLVTGATLTLYARSQAAPVWSRTLTAQEARALKLPGPWKGELEEASDLFPDKIVTVEHSPYRLEMRIDGPARDGFVKAWTVFDVLVHNIVLSWGKDEHIPEERADVKGDGTVQGIYKRVGKTGSEAELKAGLLKREKSLMAKLAQGGSPDKRTGGKDVDLELDVSAFDGVLVKNEKDLGFCRALWGDGPLIPIMAKVTIRTAADTGVLRPKALGKARFLWEWRDNDGMTREQHLETWLGPKGDATNNVSPITRTFLERLFEKHQPQKYPYHAFNCPEEAGGKRGSKSPRAAGKLVVPERRAGDGFPFSVKDELGKRSWASVSYSDAAVEVTNRDGEAVQTGILFQPTPIAGDRYRLTVYAATGAEALDKDLESDRFFDLEVEAKGVPQASTPWFTVWRKLNSTFLYTQSFSTDNEEFARAIEDMYKRELGYVIEFEKKPFPDLTRYLDAAIARETSQNTTYQQNGKAAVLRSTKPTVRKAGSDYGYDALPVEDSSQKLKEMVDQNPIYMLEHGVSFKSAAGDQTGDGMEIMGLTSGARALQLVGDLQKIPGIHLALSLNQVPFQSGEEVEIVVSKPGHTGPPLGRGILKSAAGYNEGGIAVTIQSDPALSKREIHVRIPTLGGFQRILRYPEGAVRPTRQLDDTRRSQLDTLIATVCDRRAASQKIDIEVVGRGGDQRERERAQNVEAYLNSLLPVPDRDAIYDELKKQYEPIEGTLKDAWRHIVNWAIMAWAEDDKADLDDVHRVYFSQHRGKSPYDEKFVTGAIENDISTLRVGVAHVNVPILDGEPGAVKRWLKDVKTVTVHEFGHALMLKHSPPRLMDSKDASGIFEEHLAHDVCLMNYDADTTAYCALCILRKRGWDWRPLIGPDLGAARDVTWVRRCRALMEDLVKNPTEYPWRVRLAMFLLGIREYDPAAQDEKEVAKRLMKEVVAGIPGGDAKRVWALRNMLFFYDKLVFIAEQAKDDVETGRLKTEAQPYAEELDRLSSYSIDIDDITEKVDGKRRLKKASGPAFWKVESEGQKRTNILP